MTSLYVVGGQQRRPRSIFSGDQDWYEYERGQVLHVDTVSGEATLCLDYVSPPEARSPESAVLFKSGTVVDDIFYACTQTEVLLYRLPHFEQIGYISLPCFNDVHHVRPTSRGTILVANSGLEMVLELSLDGQVVRTWNVLGEEPWAHWSREIDYRQGISTKPHRAHPNHLACVGEEIWVTRFEQRDALNLTSPDRRIPIGTERVHDGLFHNERLYFTTVNGHVVIADPETLTIEADIDLNSMHPEGTLLGWCRSIWIDGDLAWVGFSRIRPTKFRETVSWVRLGFQRSLPTHIACYDLVQRRCLTEIDLEPFGLNAIFSIFPAQEQGAQRYGDTQSTHSREAPIIIPAQVG